MAPLSDDQEEKVRWMLSELDSDPARKIMNSWEQSFVSDQLKRYDTYGSEMSLSPKQWAILEKLHEKVTE